MIKYSLKCDGGHAFESWFRDSDAYDVLARSRELACPQCGSSSIEKALMAPSIRRGLTERPPAPTAAPQPEPPAQSVPVMGPGEQAIRDMVRTLHRRIAETAENVGPAFPEEARRIHDGEVPMRPIYGQATGEEVKSLIEDGVPFLPIPVLPDEHH